MGTIQNLSPNHFANIADAESTEACSGSVSAHGVTLSSDGIKIGSNGLDLRITPDLKLVTEGSAQKTLADLAQSQHFTLEISEQRPFDDGNERTRTLLVRTTPPAAEGDSRRIAEVTVSNGTEAIEFDSDPLSPCLAFKPDRGNAELPARPEELHRLLQWVQEDSPIPAGDQVKVTLAW